MGKIIADLDFKNRKHSMDPRIVKFKAEDNRKLL